MTPCEAGSPYAFALGTIVVVEDANKNGAADPFSVGNDGVPKEGADPIVGFVHGGGSASRPPEPSSP